MSKQLKQGAIKYGAIVGVVAAGLGATVALGQQSIAAETNNTSSSVSTATNLSSLVDETVYVFTKSDGAVRKTISSDWTKNELGLDFYNKSENQVKVPVSMLVTYKLDGQTLSAEEIAHKSGKVTISYSFTNNDSKNGMYVPYAVMTGVTLNNEKFSNVTVKNAKILNDGSRTIVAGVAFPGMQSNLGISSDVLDIPNGFEITAEVKDFELGMVMSLGTSEIFAELSTDALDSVDQLSNQLTQLTDAMTQLVSGSTALYDGLNTLSEKTAALPGGVTKLTDGVNQLLDGTTQLQSGAATLSAGLTKTVAGATTLSDNVAKLDAGLAKLVGNNATLTGGAKQIFELLLTQASEAVEPYGLPTLTIENYSSVLENYVSVPAVAKLKKQLDLYNGFYQGVIGYTTSAEEIAGKTSALAAGAKELAGGTSALASGAETIATKLGELKAGTETLYDGMNSLGGSVPALVEGIDQLKDGSQQLADGINTFNKEGVQKLVDFYNNDVKALTSRLKQMVNLAKNNNASKVKYIYRTDAVK